MGPFLFCKMYSAPAVKDEEYVPFVKDEEESPVVKDEEDAPVVRMKRICLL